MTNKKDTQPKTREIPKIQYYAYCPICNEEIKGTSAKHYGSNLEIHMKLKHGGKK